MLAKFIFIDSKIFSSITNKINTQKTIEFGVIRGAKWELKMKIISITKSIIFDY